MSTTHANARADDPLTSHEAGQRAEASGTCAYHRALCLDEVRRQAGQTAAEIAEAVGLERHAPSRRLPELREAGLVRNGPARTCRVTGNPSLTWNAADVEGAN